MSTFACYLTPYSCLRILATLNWDTEKIQCVLCKRSKDSFTGLAFVFYLRQSVLRYLSENIKSYDSRIAKVKKIPKRLCHNRYAMRKLHNSYPTAYCFLFSSLLPSFLPFQKLLVTPTTLLYYSHTYIGAIIQSTEQTHTTVCHDVTRFRLTSAGGLFRIEAEFRLESQEANRSCSAPGGHGIQLCPLALQITAPMSHVYSNLSSLGVVTASSVRVLSCDKIW